MLEINGIELLPAWPVFLAFAAAGLALNFVPGADMTFVITTAARHGQRGGVIAALGIGAGTLVHILGAVVGLSAILATSATAFELIRWLGVGYLLFLAVSLVRDRRQPADAPRPAPGARLFRSAMLVNILNPKVALFFLAFLPQFVNPAAAVPGLQILALGLWFDLVGTAVNVAIALTVAGTATRLRGLPRLAGASRWIAAALMGGLALQLALTSRR